MKDVTIKAACWLLTLSFVTTAEFAQARPLQVCFNSDNGKVVSKRKCGKNFEVLTTEKLSSLSVAPSLLNSLQNQVNQQQLQLDDHESELSALGGTDILFARVNTDGTLLRGSPGVTSASGGFTGFYNVTFGQDISACYYLATSNFFPNTSGTTGVTVTTRVSISDPQILEVYSYNSADHSSINRGFTAVVICE